MCIIEAPDFSKLPLGETDFATMRANKKIYVDKTDLVVELAKNRKYVFLARPRRFGKSLLVSTLAALFSMGASAFSGLKGESRWNDDRTYPVIRLDFSELKGADSTDEFLELFDHCLARQIRSAGFPVDDNFNKGPIERWTDFLTSCEPESVVVLIDEYDAPLTSVLHDISRFDAFRKILGRFFDRTKSLSWKLRYLFVTGIMKFQQASLFSTFNNLSDVSLQPAFGSLLGYTEDELKLYFHPYIEYAASILKMSEAELIDEMRETYDGFCFDILGKTHVYTPWSVLSFLVCPDVGLGSYWFDTAGTASIVANYLKVNGMLDPKDFDAEHQIAKQQFITADQIQSINKYSLLTHAGYLTIKRAEGDILYVGYPNKEVRNAMAELYGSQFWRDLKKRTGLTKDFLDSIQFGNSTKLKNTLNQIVHDLDYQGYDVHSEAAVRQIVQIFSLGAELSVRIEVHSPKGRSDLEISSPEFDAVFEFKYAKTHAHTSKLIKAAREQIIDREYGSPKQDRPFRRIALVFDGEKRKFDAVEILPNDL